MFFDGSDEGQLGSVLAEESETGVDNEPGLGLPEAFSILRLPKNIVLEVHYTVENGGYYLLYLISGVECLVEMRQLLPSSVDDFRAFNEKFSLLIAAAAEWVRNE